MHPASRLLLALCFVTVALHTGPPFNYALVGAGILYSFWVPCRSGFNPAKVFAKMLFLAIVMLFLIHGIDYHTRTASMKGLRVMGEASVRFASVFAATLWLAKRTTKEELFALMLSFKIPMAVTVVIFRAIWFLPHISKRINDVLLAHALRDVKSSNIFTRALALSPALYSVFSSMLLEICDSSVTLLSKGIWIEGNKSSFLALRWSYKDFLAAAACLLIVIATLKGCHFA
ncbi:MAG: energy-coupling factor transporter transmembrane component T family protein [Syntrophobacteraceae bacterium]